MDLVRRFATPVGADSQTPLAASEHHVAVTFDDGLCSFAENALPELEKRNIPAALFVVADKLGTVPAWTSFSEESTWASARPCTTRRKDAQRGAIAGNIRKSNYWFAQLHAPRANRTGRK